MHLEEFIFQNCLDPTLFMIKSGMISVVIIKLLSKVIYLISKLVPTVFNAYFVFSNKQSPSFVNYPKFLSIM